MFPLINAFRPTYPWVLFCSVAGGVTSGISAGAASALNADCVPCDADGKPLNAGRDTMLLAAFTQLSSAVVPPLLGHAFVSCHDTRIAAIWGAFFSRCQRYRC